MKLDKNTIIGTVLMILLIIGFSLYNSKQRESFIAAEQARLDSLAKIEAANPKPAPVVAPSNVVTETSAVASQPTPTDLDSKYGILSPAATGTASNVVLQNDKVKIDVSTKGGLPVQAEIISGYKVYNSDKNVLLWNEQGSGLKLAFQLYGKGQFKSDEFYFIPSVVSADERGGQSLSMKLLSSDPAKYIEWMYYLPSGSYELQAKLNIVGMGQDMELGNVPAKLEWYAIGMTNEKGLSAERSKCSIFYREADEDRDYLSETAADSYTTEKRLNWMAFKQDYFSAAVISKDGFKEGSYLQVGVGQDSSQTKLYWASLGLPLMPVPSTSMDLSFYLGPNDYNELQTVQADEFHRIIDYGWSIIGAVNRYVVRPLFWFFSSFHLSWGLIILLVTIVIKTALFPITWKNFLSSAKMRVLKPEIDEINKKYEGKDAGVKQTEIMKLYQQTGVNPLAGCIPVLIQMPILYAMFRFFPAEIVLRGKSFLWADDLAAYDSIFSWTTKIPLLSDIYGNHISGFTILMCISTFIYTRMSMGAQPAMPQQPGMPNMKVMMNLFTVMMLFFFNNQPSGLALYYFIANMVSIGQMWAIKKYFINEDAIRAKIEDNKKKPKKKGGFMERLEQAQKAQRAKLAEQGTKGRK